MNKNIQASGIVSFSAFVFILYSEYSVNAAAQK